MGRQGYDSKQRLRETTLEVIDPKARLFSALKLYVHQG